MTSQKEYYLTKEGLAKLEAELEHLRTVRRPEAAELVQRALELGNTEDNEYEDAKNEQAFVEGRFLALENTLRNAVIVPSDAQPSEMVKIGSFVTVLTDARREETYQIVGSAEADSKMRRISYESPVGKALLGRRAKDVVEVVVPAGLRKLTIVKIG